MYPSSNSTLVGNVTLLTRGGARRIRWASLLELGAAESAVGGGSLSSNTLGMSVEACMVVNGVTNLYPSFPQQPFGSYSKYLSWITRVGLDAPLSGASTGNANHQYIGSNSFGYEIASGTSGGGALDVEASAVLLCGTSILTTAFRRAI